MDVIAVYGSTLLIHGRSFKLTFGAHLPLDRLWHRCYLTLDLSSDLRSHLINLGLQLFGFVQYLPNIHRFQLLRL